MPAFFVDMHYVSLGSFVALGEMWQYEKSMNKLVPITIGLQVVGGLFLLVLYIVKPTGANPEKPFVELKHFSKKYGPIKAVNALGSTLIDRARQLCNREQCIQEKYSGNRGNYITLASASRRDPCQNFRAPDCDRMRIRRELTRVLKYIDSCTIEGQVKIKNRVRIRVKCGSVSDFVSVVPARQGTAWRITADDRYPGLLPNLYKSATTGNR